MNVQLRNATKTYSRTLALDDFSLDIKSGEIVALCGLGGSGKSTLLRALSGSMLLTSGELLLDEVAFDYDDAQVRRSLFYLPDAPPLVWDENVLRNISTFLSQYQKTEDKAALDAVVAMLRKLEVVEHLESKVADLSLGDAYKVALAILNGIQPEFWILDEPFASGLEPDGIDCLKAMVEAAAKSGKTIIYSTQKVDLSSKFATQICLINKGQCYTMVTPDELKEMAKEDFLVSKLIDPTL